MSGLVHDPIAIALFVGFVAGFVLFGGSIARNIRLQQMAASDPNRLAAQPEFTSLLPATSTISRAIPGIICVLQQHHPLVWRGMVPYLAYGFEVGSLIASGEFDPESIHQHRLALEALVMHERWYSLFNLEPIPISTFSSWATIGEYGLPDELYPSRLIGGEEPILYAKNLQLDRSLKAQRNQKADTAS